LISFVAAVVVVFLVELGLRLLLPFNMTAVSTVGHVEAANASYYGWGYNPHERIRIQDPDTGELHVSRANNHGWRDRDRQIENPEGRFRVVVIGDSNVFGVTVPATKLYTRVLEERLRRDGVNAEIISMGYSGWGTDQELEALRREAVLYKPQLVVLHVTENDIFDNLMHTDPGKFGARKPVFYELSQTGSAERRVNLRFSRDAWRNRALRERIISGSEILKRAWSVIEAYKYSSRPPYQLGNNQIRQIAFVVGVGPGDPFVAALREVENQAITPDELTALAQRFGQSESIGAILRIAENRHFHEHWGPSFYRHPNDHIGKKGWRLFLAMLVEAKRVATSAGAELAIISDADEGHYEWDLYWHRVAPDDETKKRYLAFSVHLKEFAEANGIGFVDSVDKVVRSRNDAHPNEAGNQALANNLYRYLKANLGDEMRVRKTR